MNEHALDPLTYAPPALSSVTRETVGNWISSWLTERDYDESQSISIDTPFSEMGLSSIDAVELAAELSHVSKVQLDSTIAWHWPTPDSLAGYVADTARAYVPTSAEEPAGHNAAFLHLDEQGMAELLESLLHPHSLTPAT
ncbi:acyl carrier protein [Pseudomonas sp. GM79]|uniref:acyl carrier protein n=1 Tax=unclassified Pseudomonas TaxID=196821 RepID=UPI00026F84FA|nr:acyl carrier protein [Pseudomonas sp. GM79]EJN22259.1 acyl carrier protein [Pseudomonas sp. GM79]